MTPTMSAICCRRGEAPTSWPVFRSCRLSFEIVAHAKTTPVTNSANATSAGRISGVGETASIITDAHETMPRMPMPEIGTVRRADQPRHVAGDAGDQESDHEDERHRDERECRRLSGERARGGERIGERAGDREAADGQHGDPGRRDIAVALVAGCAGLRRRHRADQPADDWLRQLGQRPDRRDRNRAGADEADLRPPDPQGVCRRARRPRATAAGR